MPANRRNESVGFDELPPQLQHLLSALLGARSGDAVFRDERTGRVSIGREADAMQAEIICRYLDVFGDPPAASRAQPERRRGLRVVRGGSAS
jgi:hypothetical protein